MCAVPPAPAWLQRAELGGLTAGEGGTRWGSAGAGALMLLVLVPTARLRLDVIDTSYYYSRHTH